LEDGASALKALLSFTKTVRHRVKAQPVRVLENKAREASEAFVPTPFIKLYVSSFKTKIR
jgi:hypothetical protein